MLRSALPATFELGGNGGGVTAATRELDDIKEDTSASVTATGAAIVREAATSCKVGRTIGSSSCSRRPASAGLARSAADA